MALSLDLPSSIFLIQARNFDRFNKMPIQKLGIIRLPGVYFLDLILWKVNSDDHASIDAPHNHRAPFCVHSPG